MKTIDYQTALEIAAKFADEAVALFPGEILAVFAIGSLGSDYYRPGQSDIDTVVIVDCARESIEAYDAAIGALAERYWREYEVPKGFGAIVFAQEQMYPPYIPQEELILEILRLKTQSRLIFGSYDTAQVPTPGRQAIIDDARRFQAWADGEKEKDPDFPGWNVQTLVNSTLLIMKRYLMIARGIVEFNKFKVTGRYLANDPPAVYPELFGFVEHSLRDNDAVLDAETLARLVCMQDELAEIVNGLVL